MGEMKITPYDSTAEKCIAEEYTVEEYIAEADFVAHATTRTREILAKNSFRSDNGGIVINEQSDLEFETAIVELQQLCDGLEERNDTDKGIDNRVICGKLAEIIERLQDGYASKVIKEDNNIALESQLALEALATGKNNLVINSNANQNYMPYPNAFAAQHEIDAILDKHGFLGGGRIHEEEDFEAAIIGLQIKLDEIKSDPEFDNTQLPISLSNKIEELIGAYESKVIKESLVTEDGERIS